jgi:L-fucose isomerase-like protein
MELPNIRAAFVGFGEVNTPRELIERKCNEARKQLEGQDFDLVWTDPVSDDPEGRDVARAREDLAKEDFDLLIVCLAGWIPSHAVISVIDSLAHKPMLLWGLTGRQEGDRFVTTADQAGTTAIRKPMEDMGYTFKYVVDYLGEEPDMDEITGFAQAAQAARRLRGARIGTMGYRDMKLYGTLHDGVSLRAQIGPEVETFEMLEMTQKIDALDPKDVSSLIADMRKRWTFEKEASDETLEKPAKLYLALRDKVRERGYQAVSLIDVDGVKKLLGFPPAPVFMLLGENEGIPTVPENDTLGAVTQLMIRNLTGQIAPYMEFYEFTREGALMGVPDYIPSEIVDGDVVVTPTAFGELGEGLLNISKAKTGPVTLARLTYTGRLYQMHIVTGEAKTPRKWEEAGWTPPAPQLPSLEIVLDSPVEDFIGNVMSQHYIIAYGDHAGKLMDLCGLLGVEAI